MNSTRLAPHGFQTFACPDCRGDVFASHKCRTCKGSGLVAEYVAVSKEVEQPRSPRLLPLHGRHATGEHQYAIVDAQDYAWLSRWRWKGKRNAAGSKVYAVRNSPQGMVRLHRAIAGLAPGDPRDVRFRNGDSLDCRRENLETCSRSVTVQSGRREERKYFAQCKGCGVTFVYWSANGPRTKFCCADCADQTKRTKAQAERWAGIPKIGTCDWCAKEFSRTTPTQRYCCDICRHRAKNHRRRR